MSPDVIGYVVGAVLAGLAAWYTGRVTLRANRQTEAAKAAIAAGQQQIEKTRADGEAYQRAQAINREIVQALREEVARLQLALAELRVELRESETRSNELEALVATLQRSVDRLTRLLAEHNIPIPTLGG